MQRKTFVKILKRFGNQQRYFIDASIILEVLFDQPRKEEWFNFLTQFKGNKIALMSNFTAGEIIKGIYFFEKKFYKEYDTKIAMQIFNELIIDYHLFIERITEKTADIAKEVIEYDSRVHFEDALNIGFAKENECTFFCSLDKGISDCTLNHFGLKKVDLNK
ncbi:MAG: PIN domain-containing protein [Candidatus Diapherotrites archaeon]